MICGLECPAYQQNLENENGTNKYHKVFYTTKCGKHCYQRGCGGFVVQCTMHNAQCTIKQQFRANVVYEAFCGVVVADDVVANIGVCGNDGDNGMDDAIVQSIANHTRKVVDAIDSGPRDGGMHWLYSAIR